LFEPCLFVLETGHFCLFCVGLVQLTCLHQAADLFARHVAKLIDAIRFTDNTASLGIKLDKSIKSIRREITARKRIPDGIQIFSYKIEV
jgi:hypothetical protein